MAYRGQIQALSIGLGGLNGSDNTENAAPDELVECRNVSLARGSLTKEGGAAKYNAAAIAGNPMIIGGWDWWPSDGVQRMIVFTADGKAYKDSGLGTFPVTLAVGAAWSSNETVMFAEGGKESAAGNAKLFCFTGSDQVKVLVDDGAALTDLTTPPADWAAPNFPWCGANHEGRLWGAGNFNSPHAVYYSLQTDFEDFTPTSGGGTVNVFPGEGQHIVAMASYKGLLVVFKYPRGIYAIDTSDPSTANWRVKRISEAVGGASPRCWTMIADMLLAIDTNGTFYTIQGIREFGDLGLTNISIPVWFDDWIRNNTNQARLSFVRAVSYVEKKEAHFSLTGVGGAVNNIRVVWDFNRSDKARVRYVDFPSSQDLWLRLDTNKIMRLTSGDNAGFVWSLDQDIKSKDGAGFSSVAKTPPIKLASDVGGAARRQNGDFIEFVVVPQGTWDITANVYWDGSLGQSISVNVGGGGAVLDVFVLGTDMLGSSDALNRRKRITGSGRRFALELIGSGADQDFVISGMYVAARPGSERFDF